MELTLSFILSKLVTVLAFVVIFTLVVVVHEYGHYLLGRKNGIKVNEFSIGMGPVIFKKQGKYTRFCIRLLPIGGACVFEGEDGHSEEEQFEAERNEAERSEAVRSEAERNEAEGNEAERNEAERSEAEQSKANQCVVEQNDKEGEDNQKSFIKASVWARIAAVFAGPLFNFILAYFLAMFVCWFAGQDLPLVTGVMPGLPAEAAGIESGDLITEINGQSIKVWREISLISLLNQGKDLEVEYERDGQKYETTITPFYNQEAGRYLIGIETNQIVPCNNLSIFKASWYEVRYWFITTIRSLMYVAGGHASAEDISGPVGIATVIDTTIESTAAYGVFTTILNLVNIALLLSVNLGIMNLLPFPALDGGRLLLYFVEVVRGKPMDPNKEGMIHFVGLIILLLLMVFVFYNDIMRIVR